MITLKMSVLNMPRLPQLTEAELGSVAQDAARGVAVVVRRNFRRLSAAVGSRHFWHSAAASVSVPEVHDNGVSAVIVRKRGVRLHWKGGNVKPTGQTSEVTGRPTKSLLIPFEDSPMRKRGVTLAEALKRDGLTAADVHVIKSKGGCPILMAAKQLKRKTNLIWLGKLVKRAKFTPRPEVIPTAEAMHAEAVTAARRSLKVKLKRKHDESA